MKARAAGFGGFFCVDGAASSAVIWTGTSDPLPAATGVLLFSAIDDLPTGVGLPRTPVRTSLR
jgi:hypothetical protein